MIKNRSRLKSQKHILGYTIANSTAAIIAAVLLGVGCAPATKKNPDTAAAPAAPAKGAEPDAAKVKADDKDKKSEGTEKSCDAPYVFDKAPEGGKAIEANQLMTQQAGLLTLKEMKVYGKFVNLDGSLSTILGTLMVDEKGEMTGVINCVQGSGAKAVHGFAAKAFDAVKGMVETTVSADFLVDEKGVREAKIVKTILSAPTALSDIHTKASAEMQEILTKKKIEHKEMFFLIGSSAEARMHVTRPKSETETEAELDVSLMYQFKKADATAAQ